MLKLLLAMVVALLATTGSASPFVRSTWPIPQPKLPTPAHLGKTHNGATFSGPEVGAARDGSVACVAIPGEDLCQCGKWTLEPGEITERGLRMRTCHGRLDAWGRPMPSAKPVAFKAVYVKNEIEPLQAWQQRIVDRRFRFTYWEEMKVIPDH